MSIFKIFIIYMLNFKILEISKHAMSKAENAGKYDTTEHSTRLNTSPAATVLRSSNISAERVQSRMPQVKQRM